MFKVNNKDTGTVSLLLALNMFDDDDELFLWYG